MALTAFERWMVKSNVANTAPGERERTIATLRSNGYDRVADAFAHETEGR